MKRFFVEMNINLKIEQLILDGIDLPRHQRPLLQASVEAELGRLLTSGGLASGLQNGEVVPRLSTNTIHLTGNSDPTTLGQQIAQAVYGGLGQ